MKKIKVYMGGCEVLRHELLSLGEQPVVLEGEFAWEFPAKPGHWTILKKPTNPGGGQ